MKAQPTRRRVEATRVQKNQGAGLRSWMQDKLAKAQKARADRKAKREQTTPTIVRPVQYLVQHTDDNYATRRAAAKRTGRRVTVNGRRRLAVRPGTNRPHVNPARRAKNLAARGGSR